MYLSLLFISLVISSFYLGCLVYFKNPKGLDNRFFLYMIFGLVFWSIASYLENEGLPDPLRIFFLKADFIIAPIFGYYYFLFCYSFLENKRPSKYVNLALVSICVLLAASVAAGLVIANIAINNNLVIYSHALLFPLFASGIFFYFLGGPIILFCKYRRLTGRKKMQALYVLIGFLLTTLVVATVTLFFQEKISIELYRVMTSGFIILTGFTSYAIIKHHLFDIRSIIQRGLVYIGLFSLIIFFYLVILWIAGFVYRASSDSVAVVVAIITTILGIFSVPPIEKYFRKMTDRIFYKDKYDYSLAVCELSEILNKNIELDQIISKALVSIKKTLKIHKIKIILLYKNIIADEREHYLSFDKKPYDHLFAFTQKTKIAMYVHSENEFFTNDLKPIKPAQRDEEIRKQIADLCDQNNSEVLVSIFFEEQIIALLSLGEKMSGEFYDKDDMNLLKTFSYQAGLALAKSRLYDQLKEYSVMLERKVSHRTEKIQKLQEEQKQMMFEIAHGLQTPLTIIKNELGELQEQTKDTKTIELIEKSIDRVSVYVYRMLKLARLENDQQPTKKEKVNLSELLNELIEEYKIIAEDKGVNIIHAGQIKPNIGVFGDKDELSELITNIVSNALKFMKETGEKIIQIRLSSDGKNSELAISDNGVGISQEQLDKVLTGFSAAMTRIKGPVWA